MARVALVTGGSRGIGKAISKQLKADGYTVAATYAGNDEKAAAFTQATGIGCRNCVTVCFQLLGDGL
ncbi:MAG: SDR family NAD(P)-dependent oxidoreductase, partial [Pseudomonadota bacterium]